MCRFISQEILKAVCRVELSQMQMESDIMVSKWRQATTEHSVEALSDVKQEPSQQRRYWITKHFGRLQNWEQPAMMWVIGYNETVFCLWELITQAQKWGVSQNDSLLTVSLTHSTYCSTENVSDGLTDSVNIHSEKNKAIIANLSHFKDKEMILSLGSQCNTGRLLSLSQSSS